MFKKTAKYDANFLKENMMGPNAMKIIEEMAESLKFQEGMRVLDLGCGKGLTSIFLAKEYGVTVFATDLWITPTENYKRFQDFGLEDKIIPIHAEAHALPFAHDFFDAAVSVDAYNFFGAQENYLDEHLAPLVKTGGIFAVSVPGFKQEYPKVPEALQPFWSDECNFHSCQWWTELWRTSNLVKVEECRELTCHEESWRDWLGCDNEYARRDIDMIKAEGGNYFNTILITATRI